MSDVRLSVRRQAGEAADTLSVIGLQTRLLQTYRIATAVNDISVNRNKNRKKKYFTAQEAAW